VYLGRGEVLSALTTSGITVHRLHGINWAFTHVLKVDWSMGRHPILPASGADGEGEGDQGEDDEDAADSSDDGDVSGVTTGSLNLRAAADATAAIVGIVSRGSEFTVVGAARSPTGSLWLNVATSTGSTGWIWSQFTEVPEEADLEALADAEPESIGTTTGALNLRSDPDPAAEIVGWVGSGSEFKILGGAHSPSGWLWLNVETDAGASGWIWSHWTEYPAEFAELVDSGASDADDAADSSGEDAADDAAEGSGSR
jgi:uncharacterized protein YgiM (DUF1202 family)